MQAIVSSKRRMGLFLQKRVRPARPRVTRPRQQAIDEGHERRHPPPATRAGHWCETSGTGRTQPPAATRAANSTRPPRESGVDFGSEIMKKAKSSRRRPATDGAGCGWRPRATTRGRRDERGVGREERHGDVGPRGARHHQAAETGHQERKPSDVPPLARRHPHLSLASSSATTAMLVGLKTCLPRSRITNLLVTAISGGRHGQARLGWSGTAGRGTGRDERTSSVEGGKPPEPRAGPLHAEAHANGQGRAGGRDVEPEARPAVSEQAGKDGDLIETRVETGRHVGRTKEGKFLAATSDERRAGATTRLASMADLKIGPTEIVLGRAAVHPTIGPTEMSVGPR